MNADQIYFKTEIKAIPATHLKDIILSETTRLLFDFGQKVEPTEPEFQYLVNEIFVTLRDHYSHWKLNYVDECFRRGKLDEFDRGQKVTVKRVQYWMKCYQAATMDKLKTQDWDKVYSDEDNARFAANGRFYPNVIKFRQLHKPDFDGEEWTLKKIAETEDFKKWNRRGNPSEGYKIESLIYSKI